MTDAGAPRGDARPTVRTPGPAADRAARRPSPAASAGPPRGPSLGYRYLCVAILALAYTFNFLDRQILSILAEPVRKELHLSDGQLGLLTGFAFALFYTLFGVPIAWLADRSHRVRIVALACAVWSLFSAAGGLCGNFLQLAVARIGVGIGEAGGATPSYSIISDYFPPRARGQALALYSLGVPFGIAAGTALGGGVAAHYGWRAAFFAVGLPGLAIALLILAVVREPVRGAQDKATSLEASRDGTRDGALLDAVVEAGQPSEIESARLTETIRLFFGNPVLRWTALGSGMAAFVGYGVLNWAPAFLMRHQHMTLLQLSGLYSLALGGSVGLGTWLSGWLADRLSRRSPSAYAMIPLWGSLLTLPFLVFGFLTRSWATTLVCLTFNGALSILYLAPALAVVQNNVPAGARSTSAALLLVVLNLIGLGGGPVFVGFLSDALKPRFGVDALQIALLCLTPVLLVVVGCCLKAAQALRRAAAAQPSPG